MSGDFLDLPLYRGAVLVIGGETANTFSKRLVFFIRKFRPGLRVVISTPERFLNPKALNIYLPSYSHEVNRWIDRSNISGIITAHSAEHGDFVDAISGEVTSLRLPPMPTAVRKLLDQLGYS